MSAPTITTLVPDGDKPLRVPGPGFFVMPIAAYHADPCPEPSLSASIAVTLLDETPRHAWFAHPRLNPAFEREDGNAAMDKGSAAHEMILGKGNGLAIVEAPDWRTKAAQEARDLARLAGKVPLLRKTHDEAREIASAVTDFLGDIEECSDFFDPAAQSELVMVWEENGTWCRAMLDRLTPRGIVYDVKTGGRGLDTKTLANKFADGLEVQPAFYLRGLATLWPEMAGRFRWRWTFVENTEPFCVRVEEPEAFALGHGHDRVEHAMRIWRRCRKADRWPGYAPKIGRIGPTQWVVNQWNERIEMPSVNAPLIPAEEGVS